MNGLELLTNLVYLSLADNGLQNSTGKLKVIQPLRAGSGIFVGDEIGAKNLRVLDLRGNRLALGDLAVLPKNKLRHLAIDVSGTNVNSAADTFLMWDSLETLFYEGLLGNRITSERSGVRGPGKLVQGNSFEIIRNVGPQVTVPVELNFVEGETKSVTQLLAGSTITDPADPLTTLVTVTDPSGKISTVTSNGLQFLSGNASVDFQSPDFASPQFTVSAYLRIDRPIRTVTSVLGVPFAFGLRIDAKGALEFELGTLDINALKNNLNSYATSKATAASPLATGQFKLVAVSFDGSKMSLYVDGVMAASTQLTANREYLAAAALRINGSFKDVSFGFGGPGTSLDDVRFYGRALTATEIAVDREKNVAASSALHVWTLDEAGNKVLDAKRLADGILNPTNTVRTSVSRDYRFVDDGVYTMSVTAADSEGETATGVTKINVANVAPSASIVFEGPGALTALKQSAGAGPFATVANAPPDLRSPKFTVSMYVQRDVASAARIHATL